MDYLYLIIPLIVVIGSQAIKLATDGIRGNFDLRNFFITYGGMPSSHTALAISVTTLVGLRQGFQSALFAVALVFTLLVMRDAMTIRRMLGKHGQALNQLLAGSPDAPHFPERLGHSVLEVVAGAVWGVAVTYFLNLL